MSSVMKCDYGFHAFTWTIRNFGFSHEIKGYLLSSPNFTIETSGETIWELQVYPNGHDVAGYIACDLKLVSNLTLTATSTISIVGADGGTHFAVERINQNFPNNSFSGIEYFVKKDEIFANKNFYLPKDTLTIRCEIKRRITEIPVIKHCGIRSEIGIKHITVPWDIKHFSDLQLKQALNFPLSLNVEKSPLFEIHFYLDGDTLDLSHLQLDIKKISLYKGHTYNLEDYGRKITMLCEISILDSKGIPSAIVEGKRYFGSCADDVFWQLPELGKRIDFLTKKSQFLPDDVLSVRLELTVSDGNIQSFPAEVHAGYPESRCIKPCSTMKNDFRLLYQEQKLCDITLVTESKTLKAHKAVLSCRSPVFKSMFEHDMVENRSGIVNIPEDLKTFEQMLYFMYADQIEEVLDLKSCMKLYCAADKYQIDSLKDCCYPYLKSLISVENVCEMMNLAYKYQDDSLKTIAKAFICKHPSEIMESGVWEALMEEKWNRPRKLGIPAAFPEEAQDESQAELVITTAELVGDDDILVPKKKKKVSFLF